MSRTRTRVSRTLIGLLVLTLALGLVSYLHNLSRTPAVSTAAEPQTPATVAPLPANSQLAGVVVSQTPTAAPVIAVLQAAPPTPQPTPAAPAVSEPAPRPTSVSARPLADAMSAMDGGDPLKARTILNDALISGNLSATDQTAAKQMMADLNQTIIFSSKRFPNDSFGGTYEVKPGESLQKIAAAHNVPWEVLARMNGLSDPRKLRADSKIKVVNGPFHAVVDKSDFMMDIYLGKPGESGSMYVATYSVGLGADDSTPTGTWLVEKDKKIKNPVYYSPRGEGVIGKDDPKNPLGEFWIGLTGIDGQAVGKLSYGIHGTIEPDSIGKQASMGCIRMRNEEVELVYGMLSEGKSTVQVKD
jgi:lipoprotein-anchoring transpeptidase ErfK/SrfK